MSKLENAIRNLTPEQRALLELRLKKKRQQSTDVQHGIVQRPDRSVYPLSAGQSRLLSLEQLTPGTSRYNITEAYRLMGPLDQHALEMSVRATLERHEVLRSAYRLESGTWRQQILDTPDQPISVKDLSHLAATQRLKSALTLVREDLNSPFELDYGHLIRIRLIRMAANDHIFFVTMHHLVCDAWSFDLFLNEIATLYTGFINQTKAALPSLPIQYADFAYWQKDWLEQDEARQQLDYWQKEFEAGAEPLVLPADQDQSVARYIA